MKPRCVSTIVGVLAFCAVLFSSGCASTHWVTLRSTPRNPLTDRLNLASWSGPNPSDRTRLLLSQYDLVALWRHDPGKTLGRIQGIIAREPTPENIYAFAELAYIGAKTKQRAGSDEALNMYTASVAHAYLYLFDQRFSQGRNPYDPQFRAACELYNASLEEVMRILRSRDSLHLGASFVIRSEEQELEIHLLCQEPGWDAEDFDKVEFVSDYEVTGLRNHFRSYGLGVPLIAVRGAKKKGGPASQFYPPGVSLPVTAFLRILPAEQKPFPATEGPSRLRRHAVLEFLNPMRSSDIWVSDRLVPLETDLTTPLAYSLDNPAFHDNLDLPTIGLLNPMSPKIQRNRGLYMLQAYDPNKIPVVMIHGLWSSPMTWMEMFNDLWESPEIRDRYQFWFYFYPTGEPFLRSAGHLREELARLRNMVDPARTNPRLDQMVLVGHSMGGLLARLQSIDSGNDFWKVVSEIPPGKLDVSDDVRRVAQETFFFHYNPSVRRVVTIGTPLRGSGLSNATTRWIGEWIIGVPDLARRVQEQLMRNNPGMLTNGYLESTHTSFDSLSPDSPILKAITKAKRSPVVINHNILGRVEKNGWLSRLTSEGDGVVPLQSATAPDAVSELIVNADHTMIQRHPLTILEVRRILQEHLRESDAQLQQPPLIFQPSPLPTLDVSADSGRQGRLH